MRQALVGTSSRYPRITVRYGAFVLWLCALLLNTSPPLSVSGSRCHQHSAAELVAPFTTQAAKRAQHDWSAQIDADVRVRNSLGMSMVLIPPGEFMMGSPENEISLWDQHQDDELLHRVRLRQPFRIGAQLVRVRDFRAFVQATDYRTDTEKNPRGGWAFVDGVFKQDPRFNWKNVGFEQKDDFPVVNVSWNDATAFCRWLSAKEKMRYRLPTEAEWEYACRGGSTSPYYFGSSCNGTKANCNGNHPYGTTKKGPFLKRACTVGLYAPNPFGLFDMSGNAHQWCADWYEEDYFAESPIEDPRGPLMGDSRALRGGGWANWSFVCRSADRGGAKPNEASPDAGFRVVCELQSRNVMRPPKKIGMDES